MDYTLHLSKLKEQQKYLVRRGRILLNRKGKLMDLGNGVGDVREGAVIADLIHFIDEMIMQAEVLDRESVTIELKKSS
jgi:hypothetical protein